MKIKSKVVSRHILYMPKKSVMYDGSNWFFRT